MSAHSKDVSTERLLQLSDEVSRIATTLARLSTEETSLPKHARDLPEIKPEQVMRVIRARRVRSAYLSDDLFADPAWDMMLTLLHATLSHTRVAVSELTAGADVPPTTALRWINLLVKKGRFVRRSDPFDGRRVFVELAPETDTALRRYFAELGPIPGI